MNSPDLSSLVLFSRRLCLQPMSRAFAEDIFREFTPEITTYMYPPSPEKIEHTLEFIQSAGEEMRAQKSYIPAITLRETGEFLGGGGIHNIQDSPELGIWIKKSAHKKGYGLEAVQTLAEFAKEGLGLKFVFYSVDIRNLPSRRIPIRLGGRVVETLSKMNLSGNELTLEKYKIGLK